VWGAGTVLRRRRSSDGVPMGRQIVTNRAVEYRRRAQQCLEMAAAFRNSQARRSLSHMAQVWLRLADRNDSIPPLATEQAQPVVQQQQKIQPKDDIKK
jgi:hypothetical protein